ncbi:cell wall metabolism sensor histidine kinase WalK [Geodermatophilus sp. DSM 45219]|uniref:sensor histidine kinase n=1 Tax=Geodermatophilus sp. DSM 45219 TaxID=1881103 RepID=UPI0008899B13|nr:HAMP domain-containing sensor histidine kinase [Geodermatophilus sp. DSM 45219]SDN95112.1 two-component system, OmpR family, sensor kinase [Geodermatophilus sp. DSM 45219]
MTGTPVRPGPRGTRLPLRITLVVLIVALVGLALTATGIVATHVLQGYLAGQQEDELREVLDDYGRDPTVIEACRTGVDLVLPGPYLVACKAAGSDDLTVVYVPPPKADELPDVDEQTGEADGPPFRDWSRDGDWQLLTVELDGGYALVIGGDLGRDQRAIRQLVATQVVVGLIVLTVLGAAAYLLVRNSLRPLTEVERTARAIAAGDLSQRVPTGDERTEVGRLSLALNGMLARIEWSFRAQQESEEQARASETRMRRFVADASHELRTPLTSIRGFAELYRQGAVGSPEETARLMQRIESEGARMGVLVEDLLQLARLDQQRPLTITPVDLAEVAGDAVHDARAVQPDRPISLQLDPSLSELPVVLGDEARLRQVVGNLVTNALVHTPQTAPVTVTVSDEPAAGDGTADGDDGGVVVLRVADGGPGMAPEDAARVFERFYRADRSRARTAGGTGLGLAIVSALVAAHGGTVHLDTAPGRGAAFTVRLPRSGPGGAGRGGAGRSEAPPAPDAPAA